MSNSTGDIIENLPIKKNSASEEDLILANSIFKEENNLMIKKIILSLGDVFILGGIFLLFQNPYIDTIIKKIVNIPESWIFLSLLKTLIFMILYFFINNLKLIKKN